MSEQEAIVVGAVALLGLVFGPLMEAHLGDSAPHRFDYPDIRRVLDWLAFCAAVASASLFITAGTMVKL